MHVPSDALFVQGQVAELLCLRFKDGDVGSGIVSDSTGVRPRREGGLFHGMNPGEPPVGNGDEVGGAALDRIGGFERFDEGAAEGFVGDALFFGDEEGGAGEPVALVVEFRFLLTFLSGGPGGFPGVRAVGIGAFVIGF
jgi:hypothetical protein